MITIAYKHSDKEIAVDSRRSRGDVIASDKEKKFKTVNGVTFIQCGFPCENDILISAWFNPESFKCTSNGAFVIEGEKAYRFGIDKSDRPWKEELKCDDALGSGFKFAVAAMDFDCSAKDAVNYAKTRDSATGGRAHVFKIGGNKNNK